MMKRINVYMNDDIWIAFRKYCLDERITSSATLTEAIRQFLDERGVAYGPPRQSAKPVANKRRVAHV